MKNLTAAAIQEKLLEYAELALEEETGEYITTQMTEGVMNDLNLYSDEASEAIEELIDRMAVDLSERLPQRLPASTLAEYGREIKAL